MFDASRRHFGAGHKLVSESQVLKTFLKGLFVLLLSVAVFGGGGYYTYLLYIHPELELQADQNSAHKSQPAFVDPTLVEYQKCLEIDAVGDPLASRRTYAEFIENYPDSTKAEDARTRLGNIQAALLLSPRATPEKQVIIVKPGDVLNKLGHRYKTTPELLFEINKLDSQNLRVGQRLYSVPATFSAQIDRPLSKIIVYRDGECCTPSPIRATQGTARVGPPKKGVAAPISAKVQDKPGWKDGQRIGFGEKGFRESTRWVVLHPPGHTLFALPNDPGENLPKPPSGYGLTQDAVRELSALLRKNDTVTIK